MGTGSDIRIRIASLVPAIAGALAMAGCNSDRSVAVDAPVDRTDAPVDRADAPRDRGDASVDQVDGPVAPDSSDAHDGYVICHLPLDSGQPFGPCPPTFDDPSWKNGLCPFPFGVSVEVCEGYRSRHIGLWTHSYTCYYDPAALTLVAAEFVDDINSFCDRSDYRMVLGEIPTAGACGLGLGDAAAEPPFTCDGGADSRSDGI